MKATLQALVVKKNDVTLAVEGVNKYKYGNDIRIKLSIDMFTQKEIKKLLLLERYKSPMIIKNDYVCIGVDMEIQSVKDICGTYGCLNLSIVDFDVEL